MQSFAVIAISPHSPLTIHFAKDFSTGFENIVALLAQLEQIYRYISNLYKYISTYIYILYVNEEKKISFIRIEVLLFFSQLSNGNEKCQSKYSRIPLKCLKHRFAIKQCRGSVLILRRTSMILCLNLKIVLKLDLLLIIRHHSIHSTIPPLLAQKS